MKTTIIIPTYNEKENIEEIIKAVFAEAKKVKNHDINILIVDDNSPDGTQDLVHNLQKRYPDLHLITGEKEGLGKAYLRGMEFASKKLDADIMFEMDADFSHDPKEIPAFLAKIDQGYDLVIGSRYIPGGSIPANWGIHRIFFSVIGNFVVRTALFNFAHHDWTTGYRAIRTPLYKKVRRDLEEFKGYTFQVSFLHKAFLLGAKVAETPIQFKDRVHGKSKIGSEYVINLAKYLLEATIKNPPRQFRFIIVGGSSFVIQATTFGVLKAYLSPQIANAIGFTFAVTNNFFSNNFWTFSDRKKKLEIGILVDYAKLYITSLFSLALQTGTISLSIYLFGDHGFGPWFGFLVGVFIGLFVNYTIYSKIIWREKK